MAERSTYSFEMEASTTVLKDESRHCISVDYVTFPCKIACFLLVSGVGCLTSFANVFLVSIGLTSSESGFIMGTCFGISAIAGPCWGLLADKTGHRKFIFVMVCLGFALTGFSWPWVAREVKMRTALKGTSVLNKNITTEEKINATSWKTVCKEDSNVNSTNASTIDQCELRVVPFSNPLFYTMFCMVFLTFVFLYPSESFLNSIISNIIENNPTTQDFGKQRMFGAIGVGTANLFAGFAADAFTHPTLSKYTAIFIYFPPLVLLMIPVSFLLFRRTKWETKSEAPEAVALRKSGNDEEFDVAISLAENIPLSKANRLKILLKILSKLDNLVIMTTVLVSGVTRSITISFLFLIIRDEMDGSRTSMGLSMMVNSFSSAAMFFFSKKLIKKLGGPIVCVELSLVAWIIRLVLISYIKNSWLMCIPQSLQSVGFALYWAAMIQHIQDISSKEVYITLFTFLTSLNYGAGGFLGNIIGGAVYNDFSGPVLCQFAALFVAVWLVFLIAYFHVAGCVKKKLGTT